MEIAKILSIAAQIAAYILAVVLIIQLLRAIFGGTWKIEDIILALSVLNITITFGIGGYLIYLHTKISEHLGWHNGKGDFN